MLKLSSRICAKEVVLSRSRRSVAELLLENDSCFRDVNLTDDEESLAARESTVSLIQAVVGRQLTSRHVTNLNSNSSL
jgi:hypothetical protein